MGVNSFGCGCSLQALKSKHVHIYPQVQTRTYGRETILFHSGTGDTVMLHPLAASLVEYLQQHQSDTLILDAALRAVADRENFEFDEDFSSHLTQLTFELFQQRVVYFS